MCELYGKVRVKWPYLSEKYFRLATAKKELSPENANHLSLDDDSLELQNNSTVVVKFQTPGGTAYSYMT